MGRAVKTVIGSSLSEAIVYLDSNNIPWCVSKRDSVPVRNTMDYVVGRLQLEVNNDIVTNVVVEK